MSTVPYGNPAGNNQANPAVNSGAVGSTVPTTAPIAGGSAPSQSNPYMFGGATPTSTAVPASPTQQQNLQKQWTDIYGKGTGGAMASEYAGMQGTDSAAFQAYLSSVAPVWAQQQAGLGQNLGAAGVGANSTVAALAQSNLGAQQAATASGVDANMIMQNQQERLGLLTGTEQASEQEVASSGWDVFGQVIGDVGSLAGSVMGMGGLPNFMKMFSSAPTPSIPTSNIGMSANPAGE